MSAARRLAPLAIAALVLVPFAAACSEETQDNARDTVESLEDDARENAGTLVDEVEEGADEAGARAAAEELRARVEANDTADAEGLRSMAAIEESAKDLVGDPEVEGIEDTTGDGLDDDGKIQVNVGEASACLTLPESGDDATVEDGPC